MHGMYRVGRIYGFVNEEVRMEWRKLLAKNPDSLKEPLKFGAILAITDIMADPPERFAAIDESIVCRKCEGSGYFPTVSELCPKCKGIGRRRIAPPPKPQFRPSPAWLWSPLSQLFPHLGR